MYEKNIENKNRLHIIVDSDVDGYTSGSMMYRYLKLVDPKLDITYSLHTAKQHGLMDISLLYGILLNGRKRMMCMLAQVEVLVVDQL